MFVIKDTNRFKIIAISCTILLLLPVYFFFDPMQYSLFPECPFYTLTGLYCPGCGSQRAVHALLHGDFLTAIHYNLLACISLPFIFYSAGIFVFNTFYNKQIVQNIFYRPWFIKAVLIVVVLFWILRNLPFPGFYRLAP